MIPRHALAAVRAALDREAAVALIGPRQVGKTTLALAIAESTNSLYLDLEATQDRDKLVEAALFLRAYEDRLVVLDEIHRAPEIFQTLRGLIDQGRRRGHRTGRFLILGSASVDLLRQSGESLAGRIAYVDMGPFDVREVVRKEHDLIKLWGRGGFPQSYLGRSDERASRGAGTLSAPIWNATCRNSARAFLPRLLGRLWTMLANGQGTLLNASRLAASLSISAQSVTRYVDLLADLLLVRRLQPFHGNLGKRLVKSPKVYVRDSGLVHALLGIVDHNQLSGHPVVGMSWEGFVMENLLTAMPWHTLASFYRTTAGAEIDLVLEIPGHGLWAIEIKHGLSARPEKGFHIASEDLKPARRFIVHSGTDRYPVGSDLEAIGLQELASLLATL